MVSAKKNQLISSQVDPSQLVEFPEVVFSEIYVCDTTYNGLKDLSTGERKQGQSRTCRGAWGTNELSKQMVRDMTNSVN